MLPQGPQMSLTMTTQLPWTSLRTSQTYPPCDKKSVIISGTAMTAQCSKYWLLNVFFSLRCE